jgi:hypothetical protein
MRKYLTVYHIRKVMQEAAYEEALEKFEEASSTEEFQVFLNF